MRSVLDTVCGFDGPRSALATMRRDDAAHAIARMRASRGPPASASPGRRCVFRRRSWSGPHHASTMALHHLDPIGVLLGLLVVLAYRRLRHR
jgi:hypothetical protein